MIPDQWVKELLVKPLSPRLTRFGDNEGVVAEGLCDQSDRDPAEGAPHELFSTRFREVERHNRNVALILVPRSDLAGSCGWMLYSVDGVDRPCGAALDS